MAKRSNSEWLAALQQPGKIQDEALADLREYLVRAAFVYLRDGRSELNHLNTNDLFEMAEDFAQDALLNIRRHLDKFRGDAKFTTWAYRFVINEAAADLRRRRYKNFSWDALKAQETAVFAQPEQPGRERDPRMSAERMELLRFLLDIIQTELNESQRAAIIGIHFQDRSVQEMAEYLDTSPNTLYKMLHDARKKIKAKLLAKHYSAGDILGLFDSLW